MKPAFATLTFVALSVFGAASQNRLPPYQIMDFGPVLFWTSSCPSRFAYRCAGGDGSLVPAVAVC